MLHWLPDWRDATQYPDPFGDLSLHSSKRWAWEFLRRNPDYERDRAEWKAALWPDPYSKHLDALRRRLSDKWGIEQSLMEWPESANALGFHTLQWPLHEVAFIRSKHGGNLDSRHYEQQLQTRSSQVWIRFDVADHLDHQLTNAEEILRQLATSVPKHRRRDPQKLLDYLRVHDATTTQIAYSEIAATLHPELPDAYPTHEGRDRVRKDFQAANALIAGGFLTLRIKERN